MRIGLTFLLVLFSWVLFRANDLAGAGRYFAALFGLAPGSEASLLLGAGLYTPYRILILALAGVLVFQPLQAHDWAQRPQTWGRVTVLAPLFALGVVVMFGQSFNPFLYFQF